MDARVESAADGFVTVDIASDKTMRLFVNELETKKPSHRGEKIMDVRIESADNGFVVRSESGAPERRVFNDTEDLFTWLYDSLPETRVSSRGYRLRAFVKSLLIAEKTEGELDDDDA